MNSSAINCSPTTSCSTFQGVSRSVAHEILANDDYAVALVRFSGERDGKALEDTGVQVFRITNGKISERWSYPGDLYKTDDFFA